MFTSIDNGIAAIVFAEQDIFLGSILLKHLSYAGLIVHYESVCRQDTKAVQPVSGMSVGRAYMARP